jgi:hypothetical protein
MICPAGNSSDLLFYAMKDASSRPSSHPAAQGEGPHTL